MTIRKTKRIATTLTELRRMTAARNSASEREIEAQVVFEGKLTFTIPDLLDEDSDGPAQAKAEAKETQLAPEEEEMPGNTHYVVQGYVERTVKSGRNSRMVLERGPVIECKNADDAKDHAQKIFKRPSCVGVDAFSVTVDVDLGDYGEPEFLLRLGKVPELELELA